MKFEQTIGPSHHSDYCKGKRCTKSSLDFAPSLFMSFEEDFSYFGSEGTIVASHRGTAHRPHGSPCKLAIVGVHLQTWYSHMRITVEDYQEVEQGDVIGFVETRRSQANCECDPAYCKCKFEI